MKALELIGQQDVALTAAAIPNRDEVLATAATVTKVDDELDQEEAAEALKALAYIDRTTEEARQAVKAPVLDLGRKIDGLASQFVGPVKVEIQRIKGLMTKFAAEQSRKAREAEEARQAELRRLAEEDRKAKAAAAEAARQAAEAEFLASSKADAEKAAQAAKAAQDEAARAEAARVTAIATTRKIEPPKVAGISAVPEIEFEVTDVAALYRDMPHLVVLTPKMAEIRKALKAGKTLSGVRSWKATGVRVRA